MFDELKVLVVDDSAIYRSLISGCVRELPDLKCVGLARDGREAIAKAESLRPDLILLDVEMPSLNGYEVCARLKANPVLSHIPVIFVTSRSDPKDQARGLMAGVDGRHRGFRRGHHRL